MNNDLPSPADIYERLEKIRERLENAVNPAAEKPELATFSRFKEEEGETIYGKDII